MEKATNNWIASPHTHLLEPYEERKMHAPQDDYEDFAQPYGRCWTNSCRCLAATIIPRKVPSARWGETLGGPDYRYSTNVRDEVGNMLSLAGVLGHFAADIRIYGLFETRCRRRCLTSGK